MEVWLKWAVGAYCTMIAADVIRVAAGPNLICTGLWVGSIYMLYQSWESSPWRHSDPVISGAVMLVGYVVMGIASAALLWFIRSKLDL